MQSHSQPARSARLELRRQARVLAQQPGNVGAHLVRIHAALGLEGVEPVQGALVDMFGRLGMEASDLKAAALRLAGPRLGERLAHRFEAWVSAPALPPVSSLATRWCQMVIPSADVSTRVRRCSPDDSRLMAEQFLQAQATWQPGDEKGQGVTEAFLHHCVTCHDKLAFMLVRREMIRKHGTLLNDWRQAERELLNEGQNS